MKNKNKKIKIFFFIIGIIITTGTVFATTQLFASDVGFTPTGNISATNLQSAIEQVYADVINVSGIKRKTDNTKFYYFPVRSGMGYTGGAQVISNCAYNKVIIDVKYTGNTVPQNRNLLLYFDIGPYDSTKNLDEVLGFNKSGDSAIEYSTNHFVMGQPINIVGVSYFYDGFLHTEKNDFGSSDAHNYLVFRTDGIFRNGRTGSEDIDNPFNELIDNNEKPYSKRIQVLAEYINNKSLDSCSYDNK